MAKTDTAIAVAEHQDYAPDVPSPDFFMHTDAMKAAHDDDGDRPIVLATASSTAVDLEADRFTAKALKQMKDGFVGKLIFLNHSYKVPMDVFGVVTAAELLKRDGHLDLDIKIGVEMNNPLAVQTYQYIVNGTRLGVSVGVIVTDADKSDDEDQYGNTIFDIDGVIPLEASVVGIPANQTAWTRQAIKSLHERGALILDNKDIEARPWLKTVAQIREAAKTDSKKSKEALVVDQKETRLWVTTDDGAVVVEITGEEKEKIMSQQNETDKQQGALDTDGDKDKSEDEDAPEGAEKPDSTSASEGGDNPKPNKDEEPDGDNPKPNKDEEPDGDDPDDKDEEPDESKVDSTDKADSEEKSDFDDAVAADEAVDMLINKMFTGLYAALDTLIPILMNTDSSVSDREKEGDEIIASWTAFIEDTWAEITDNLDASKDVDTDKEIDLSTRLHSLIAEADEVSCDQHGLEAVAKKVKDIGDAGQAIAEDNTKLRDDNARQTTALKYMEQLMETLMELPLKTVTTQNPEVAQSLAAVFPGMDTRVVERMARFAPSDPTKKE